VIIPFPGVFKSPEQRMVDSLVQRMEALMADPAALPDALPAELRMVQLLKERTARKRSAIPAS
jgi:hypothetical protein